MSANNINFIEIDPKKDIQDLIEKFEVETGSKVYEAQDTNVLIHLMAYYANLLKCQFNSSAKLNLVEYSRYPILDFLGRYKNCTRLEGEEDESYINRILLAPEGFSVAGPETAYIYHALSADSSIIDVAINVPNDDIKVSYNNETIEITGIEAENDVIRAEADYFTGNVNLTLKQNLPSGANISVEVPHPFMLEIYVLSENLPVNQDILQKVSDNLKEKCPLLDRITVKSANSINFSIDGIIKVSENTDIAKIQNDVNDSLNDYLNKLKISLKTPVILKQIEKTVMNIEGVVDCNFTAPADNLPARFDSVYLGAIGDIQYERGE